jgi:hypothetical protein
MTLLLHGAVALTRCIVSQSVGGKYMNDDRDRAQGSKQLETKRIYDPPDSHELLRGWLLHAHKERDRHNAAARRYARKHISLGVLTVGISAAAGTSVFASLSQTSGIETPVGIAVGLLSVTAAVLASLQTFLNHAGRAEDHRRAAVRCKALIRQIEDALARWHLTPATDEWIGQLREAFDKIEDDAPVVAIDIFDSVEHAYKSMQFVDKAERLYSQNRDAA